MINPGLGEAFVGAGKDSVRGVGGGSEWVVGVEVRGWGKG